MVLKHLTLRRRVVLGGAAAAVAGAIASAGWACTLNMSGTLSLSPSSGPAGTSVTVNASGQLPLVTYNVLYLDPAAFFAAKACHTQGTNMGTATASSAGSFSKTITIPATVGTPAKGTAEICDQDVSNQVDGAHAYFSVT